MNSYFIGDLVQVTTGTGLVDSNNNPIDPTALTLTVGQQGQTAVISWVWNGVGNIVHVGTGNFQANLDTRTWIPGTYWYKWVATGTAQAVMEGVFVILPVNV